VVETLAPLKIGILSRIPDVPISPELVEDAVASGVPAAMVLGCRNPPHFLMAAIILKQTNITEHMRTVGVSYRGA
jgi:hypothetical protein